MENPATIERVADRIRTAYESADLAAIETLLDPLVTWGPPGDTSPPCRSKAQVLAWYRRGRSAGAVAEVAELTVIEDRILLGLVLSGTQSASEQPGTALRWQLLTVKNGLICDIVGFDDRNEAFEFAGASTN